MDPEQAEIELVTLPQHHIKRIEEDVIPNHDDSLRDSGAREPAIEVAPSVFDRVMAAPWARVAIVHSTLFMCQVLWYACAPRVPRVPE